MSFAEDRAVPRRPFPAIDRRRLLASIRRDGLVLGLMLGTAATALVLRGAEEAAAWPRAYALGVASILLTATVSAVILRLATYLLVTRPEHPTLELLRDARALLADRFVERWVPLLLCFAAFTLGFTQMKGASPHLAGGFHWDAAFGALDRALHFGRLPHEWLMPALGSPPVLFLLNLNYNVWFAVVLTSFFAFAARPAGAPGRTRFLLAFPALWIVAGVLAAAVFASAGPCFYALVVPGADPYAPLMRHLEAANQVVAIWSLDVQRLLWADYESGAGAIGLSAMPSLHNAMAMLVVLASRSAPRWLRLGLVVHATLVLLGSILLAWHYAVDAYLGWALAAVVWRASAPVARWWDARAAGTMPVAARV